MNEQETETLTITIQVSLDDAERIAATLSDGDEWHLAEHVNRCIKHAKAKDASKETK